MGYKCGWAHESREPENMSQRIAKKPWSKPLLKPHPVPRDPEKRREFLAKFGLSEEEYRAKFGLSEEEFRARLAPD
jgi:acetyl-CoA acetyltransferase